MLLLMNDCSFFHTVDHYYLWPELEVIAINNKVSQQND